MPVPDKETDAAIVAVPGTPAIPKDPNAITITLITYIVKHFAFHQAFPMVSLSYVMGMLAAVFIFHEEVPFTRWIGLAFILVGVALITK